MNKKRIGVVVDTLDRKLTGTGIYTKNLLLALFQLDKKNEYTLIHSKKNEDEIFKFADEMIIPKHNIPAGGAVRKIFIMPSKIKQKNFDIIHDTFHFGPFFFNNKFNTVKIITIYDIIPIIKPGLHRDISLLKHKLFLKRILKHTDKIITISKSTKRDIKNELNVPPEKIEIVYPGLDNNFLKNKKEQKDHIILNKLGIKIPYIFFNGTLEIRKNLLNLILAFEYLKLKERIPHMLVLSGKKGQGFNKIKTKSIYSDFAKDIKILGYTDIHNLLVLYRNSDLFVYPSFYEGFGMPPLEAMASGSPVITSNTSSLPEVVGSSALTVDPYNAKELKNTMKKIIFDRSLHNQLKIKGLNRAKEFRWENSAKKLMQIYEEFH